MKKLIILLLLTVSGFAYSQKGRTSIINSHTILLMGQSNAAGFDHPAPADATTYPPKRGQFIFEPVSQTWQQLQQNVNNSGSATGPFPGWQGCEMVLMQMLKDYYGSDQYMIKYATGGTSLSELTADAYNWSPKSTNYYMFSGAVTNCNLAMATFPTTLIKPTVLIWWQGEDDTDSINSVAYEANFNDFIFQFKNQCNLPNLLVISIGLSDNQTAYGPGGKLNVNNAHIRYSIHGNKFINTDGYSVMGGVHFDTTGQAGIAVAIFNIIKTML